jgi:hypothetical protein
MVAWTAAVPCVGEGPAVGPVARTVRQAVSARQRAMNMSRYFMAESFRARLDHIAWGGRKAAAGTKRWCS